MCSCALKTQLQEFRWSGVKWKLVQRGTERQPATGKAPVAHGPRTRTEAKSDQGDPQVKRKGDDKDEGFKPNIDIIADTLTQVLKKQLPKDTEINDTEKPVKSQPLAKASSESHLINGFASSTSIDLIPEQLNDNSACKAALASPRSATNEH